MIITAHGIVPNDLGELLIVRKGDHYLLPGGRIREGETALETLSRELDEETGLMLLNARPLGTYEFEHSLIEKMPLRMHVFFAQASGTPSSGAEIAETLWMSKEHYASATYFPKSFWNPIFRDLAAETQGSLADFSRDL